MKGERKREEERMKREGSVVLATSDTMATSDGEPGKCLLSEALGEVLWKDSF